jgi:hypothetical protein
LRRKEIAGSIALGGFILLVALLALRFDLPSLLFFNAATIERATPSKPDSAASIAATVAPERRVRGERPSIAEEDRLARAAKEQRLAKAPVEAAPAKSPSSSFDVVRIDPEGSSVFAGRAPAHSNVTVLANEKPVASAKANADGQWATVIDRQFTPGEYQLSLTAKPSEAAAPLSGQSVNITIAATARPMPPQVPKAAVMPPPAPVPFPYDEAGITDMPTSAAPKSTTWSCRATGWKASPATCASPAILASWCWCRKARASLIADQAATNSRRKVPSSSTAALSCGWGRNPLSAHDWCRQ